MYRVRSRIFAAAIVSLAATGYAFAGAPTHKTPLYYQSLKQLQHEMRTGKLTSVELTRTFIARIKKLGQNGPHVNAVILVNPNALKVAAERDRARKAGKAHGLLFGIPVLVKDNMDTHDMPTTAGSLALEGPPPPRDSTVVAKLRAAGAIILGKANLSEWANFRSTHSTSGWSGVGGLTHNPYVLPRNACGSSSGSGAGVSAGFSAVALGTETDGSLTCPSSVNGVVDIRPTLGLVSRAGIVPISHSQDDPGPMARSVADAAAVLTVLAGSDPRDPATADANKHKTDYTKFLKRGKLKGKRIGVICGLAGDDPQVLNVLNHSVAALRRAGATVMPVKLPNLHKYGKDEFTVLLYEFKHDLNAYLKTRKGLKVHSLADIIAFNKAHARQEMPWFGQNLMIMAEAKGPLSDPAYKKALAAAKRMTGPDGIDAALKAHHLNALMAPASGPAWTTDLVNGDHVGAGGDSPAAVAGYPSIEVPAGNIHGLPMGMTFFAGKWSEPTLIEIGYDFEQDTKARIRPHFLAHAPLSASVPTLAQIQGDAPPPIPSKAIQPVCPDNLQGG